MPLDWPDIHYADRDRVQVTPMYTKEQREERGLTQEGLADLLGISVRTVQGWERKSRPSKPDQRHQRKLDRFFSKIGAFSIGYLDPVLLRRLGLYTTWQAGLFKELHPCGFWSMESNFYTEVAPLEGNEERIGTSEECFGSWDVDKLKEEGII